MSSSSSEHNIEKTGLLARRSVLKFGVPLVAASLTGCSKIMDNVFKEEKVVKYPSRRPRINVLSSGIGLQVDKSFTTPVTLPHPQDVTSWTQLGGAPQHVSPNAHLTSLDFSPKHEETHSIGAGAQASHFSPMEILSLVTIHPNSRGMLQSPPVIGGGHAYTMDAKGLITAWSWPNMKSLWTYQPGKGIPSSNMGGGCALGGDTLYGVDGVSSAWALDAVTGKEKWKVDIGTPGRSAPLLVDGVLYFTTIDDHLYVLNAATGEELWTYRTPKSDTVLFGAATPTYLNGILIAAFGSGELVALRANSGELLWSDSLGGSNGRGAVLDFSCIRGTPVIADDTVYAISLSQVLVAIDIQSGRRIWEREVSGQNTLCVCGDWLYVLSLDQMMACIERSTGRVRWATQLPEFVKPEDEKGEIVWTGPLLAQDKLICVSSHAKEGFAVIDALSGNLDGIFKAKFESSVMPISCDGRILVTGDDGNLRIYK